MEIRSAIHEDADRVSEIFNHFIRSGTETFNSVEKSPTDICDLIDEKTAHGHGAFVAVDGGGILGFAYYGQFRGGVGYARTMEHTIYVVPEAKGRGIGRALMQHVEDHARIAGGHSIYAGVSAENVAGIAFHERMGYNQIWTLPEAGYKFGRYIDLVLMLKFL